MKKAKIILTRDYTLGHVRDRMFSSFVEHMGSCVYNGIFEPGHPEADENGFRQDVLKLVNGLKIPAIRYPGGNYTSGYNWEDSVGKNRQKKLDLAWKQLEPNTFGLHEFLDWLKQANNAELIMTVNLGTRGADDARNVLEYCNHPGGGFYSDMRRANGAEKPFNIRTWCLGNELDGTWQIGHKTATEYGRIAAETARIMRMLDKNLELIAVGSSSNTMPTFPEWDRQVLMECYDDVDYLGMHKYVFLQGRDVPTYLAAPIEMERQIRDLTAACDYVKSVLRSPKRLGISVDEWNLASPFPLDDPQPEWQIGPDRDKISFRFVDALAFASMMLTLLRNADRVHIACQAILVNVIPMIVANKKAGSFANTTYYPFMHGSLYGRGEVLRILEDVPKYDCKEFTDVPVLDTAAVYNEERGEIALFIVNRGPDAQTVDINLREFGKIEGISHIVMTGALEAANTEQNPFACVPSESTVKEFEPNNAEISLQGYSWNVIRIDCGCS